MSAEALRDELLAVEGVADAEVDGDAPSNVRVKLSADADPERVGEEVQRILSTHGMRSRVGTRRHDPDRPPPPPGAPAEVVSIADYEATVATVHYEDDEDGEDEPGVAPGVVTGARLAGVSVEESRDGVVITVRALDGRQTARRARWSEGGMEEAIVDAVASLLGTDGPPRLVGVHRADVEGAAVVALVVERVDGRRVAGAAVVEAGLPYAIARAAWAALQVEG